MMKKRLTLCILACTAAVFMAAASSLDGRFHSITLPSGRATSVFSIAQDSSGFIWVGTDDGLARYDGSGFRTYRWMPEDTLCIVNNVVNALLYDESAGMLYAGTDKGVSIYDPLTDSFSLMPGTGGRHVKAFLADGADIYIGTTSGLFKADYSGISRILDGHFTNVRKAGGRIWAASYGCIYDVTDGGSPVRHGLSHVPSSRADVLVLDVCADAAGGEALWIGTESGMFRYVPSSRESGSLRLENIPVKTFLHVDGRLWAGTDNGLIVMDESSGASVFRHQVDNDTSIPNNVVWCIVEDRTGNVWLGTDHGVAVADMGGMCRYIGVNHITGTSDGLDVSVMKADCRNRLWLGGRNGLICADSSLEHGIWLRADSSPAGSRLSHNKVRGLHDDGDILWIVSDGGLDSYSYSTGKVMNCTISEPTGRYSSNWSYSIAEDSAGRLWIGTYDGGLFGVSKERMLSSDGCLICDVHLNADSGPALAGNIVRNVVVRDSILYAETSDVVNIISLETFDVRQVQLPHDVFVLSMMSYGDYVWIGTDKGLYRLDETGNLSCVSDDDIYAAALTYHDGRIWTAGRSTLASYCIETGLWTRSNVVGHTLMSICAFGEALYLGTVDGILEYAHENPATGEYVFRFATTPPAEQRSRTVLPVILSLVVLVAGIVVAGLWRNLRKKRRKEDVPAAASVSSVLPLDAEELVPHDEKFLKEMLDIVQKHMDDTSFSVSALCSESRWSDKQVYRKMKQLTGKTVSEFIRDVRLEKAAAYLEQAGWMTVNEVMYKVGFTTPSYFSKCFKEKYGKSPSEYRRE